MSVKNLDKYKRWRCHTISFRMSPEESRQLNIAVKLSGQTKQDYICNRCLNRNVVVQGNPRVYKALKDQLKAVLCELNRITSADKISPELKETIDLIVVTLDGMKGDALWE